MNIQDAVTIAGKMLGPILKASRWTGRRLHLVWFNLIGRKTPFDKSRARKIAVSALAGNVTDAIAFRNIDSPHIFMAVRRTESAEAPSSRIHLLEQFGNTYRCVWQSEPLWELGRSILRVVDIDRDGIHEVAFSEEAFGTGAGSRVLYVKSLGKKQLFQIREFYNWQDATGPVTPRIDVEPEPDEKFGLFLERFAVREGFLRTPPEVDLDSPDYAVQRWHAENGKKRNGIVKIHFFDGLPQCRSSVAAALMTPQVTWTAYFKGALFGYIRAANKHFIAFSPAWIYNWVKCLAWDGKALWFGLHVDKGVLRFSFDGTQGMLNYYAKDSAGAEIPEVESIEFRSNQLLLNDSTPVYPNQKTGRLERVRPINGLRH